MIYRAVVVEVRPAGPVVTIVRRAALGEVGPVPSTVADLEVGDRVLAIDDVDGRVDAFAVIGRLV